jgi:hypothetical protein
VSLILGIDPGKTIGLCVYDDQDRRVVSSETCTVAEIDAALHRLLPTVQWTVIERPRVYGMGGGEIANAIEQCGWLIHRCGGLPGCVAEPALEGSFLCWGRGVFTCERRGALRALSGALGETVAKDAGVWAALVTLHGEGSGKKGGALGGCKSHSRAALAVAWTAAQVFASDWLDDLPF